MSAVRIQNVVVSAGLGGYYFDDLQSIKAGAKADGFMLLGQPMTEDHASVRQAGEAISIILVLDDGQYAFGDCAAIQYSGVVGRDPILLAAKYVPLIERDVAPRIKGMQLTDFRHVATELDCLEIDGRRLHTGIRYGLTQALLDAVSKSRRQLMAEVIRDEYGTTISEAPVPVLAQSGDERYTGADKMILKRVPAIPQGLFNTEEKVGREGERLLEYVRWLRGRVEEFGADGYRPTFHLDVYGWIGELANRDVDRMVQYCAVLEKAAEPFPVRVEAPIDTGDKGGTLELMAELRAALERSECGVEIVADDWCNTLEDIKEFADAGAAHMIQIKMPDLGGINNSVDAVLYCKKRGIKAFLGGTCNETDQSSRITVNLALATCADLIYNKPGMGVDEGLMIVTNEMNRVLAILARRREQGHR
jgi:methylaspartate ammonia-lyase